MKNYLHAIHLPSRIQRFLWGREMIAILCLYCRLYASYQLVCLFMHANYIWFQQFILNHYCFDDVLTFACRNLMKTSRTLRREWKNSKHKLLRKTQKWRASSRMWMVSTLPTSKLKNWKNKWKLDFVLKKKASWISGSKSSITDRNFKRKLQNWKNLPPKSES